MFESSAQLLPPLLAVIGLACLIGGADFLVRGGARLARAFHVSPVVIGLTVVAIGTSAPELMVSLGAAWRGSPDLATGNVVGSNLANIGLVLGIAGLLRPLPVSLRLLKVEVPALVAATVGFAAMAADGRLNRLEGGVLLASLCALTGFNIRAARREDPDVVAEFEAEYGATDGIGRDLIRVAAGLGLLLGGGHILVDAAVTVARSFGISELIIGLTLVAVGTSLPELATAVVAVRRDEPDIAVGNVVGSNLFNILAVIGPTAVVQPIAVSAELLRVQLPALLLLTAALWVVLRTGHTATRWEAGGLLASYLAVIAVSAL